MSILIAAESNSPLRVECSDFTPRCTVPFFVGEDSARVRLEHRDDGGKVIIWLTVESTRQLRESLSRSLVTIENNLLKSAGG